MPEPTLDDARALLKKLEGAGDSFAHRLAANSFRQHVREREAAEEAAGVIPVPLHSTAYFAALPYDGDHDPDGGVWQ